MKNVILLLFSGLLIAVVGCRQLPAVGDLPYLEVPYTATPPVIDGDINDKVWQHAAVVDGLTHCLNKSNKEVIDTLPTTIKLLWDKDYLYLNFKCIDPDVYYTGKLANDGNLVSEDVCTLFIDGYGDGRSWIEIQVNPSGVRLDKMYLCLDKPKVHEKKLHYDWKSYRKSMFSFVEWDMKKLKTGVKITGPKSNWQGWSVEMAVPAKDLVKRYGLKNFKEDMELRANLIRYDRLLDPKTKKREMIHMNWSPVWFGCPHISPGQMGTLKLVKTK